MGTTARLSLCLLLLLGCESDSLTNFHRDISVEVEKDVYTFNSGQGPTVTLRNDSRFPVYLVMGSYLGFEQLKNGKWINFSEWFVVDGIGSSWSLGSGESIRHNLAFGRFRAEEIPGTYRFHFRVYADQALTILLPVSQRVSQPFEVLR